MVFCFKTENFEGRLKQNGNEGEVFWVDIEKLNDLELSPNLKNELPIFSEEKCFEGFAQWNSKFTEKLKWS